MIDIKWENPPVSFKGPGARERFAKEALVVLRHSPDRWALLKSYKSRNGAWNSLAEFRARNLLPGCELRAKRKDTGSALYAKYVGRKTA